LLSITIQTPGRRKKISVPFLKIFLKMPNQDRIAQLEAYKLKDRFIIDDWEDREAVPTSRATITHMRQEVLRFADFLIQQLQANVPDLQQQVQQFFNDWDNEDFTQDETEFIVEVEYEAMRIAGVKIDDLLI
jgi:hypothetical protein